jgi:Mg2+ and Co2+ transporter CorA
MEKIQYKQFAFYYTTSVDAQIEAVLQDQFEINELDVEDIFSDTQLSKLEIRRNYFYIALQIPEFDKARQKFLIKDLHCFVSNDWVVIIDKQNYKHFQQFVNFQDQLLEDEEIISSNMFFAEILDFCMTKTYKAIMKFKTNISQLESDVFEFADDIDNLKEILILKKNLVNFESVIEPLQETIQDLTQKVKPQVSQSECDRLENSLDTANKILNNILNFKAQMILLTQTNESLTRRNSNIGNKGLRNITLWGFLALFVVQTLILFKPSPQEGQSSVVVFGLVVLALLIGVAIWALSQRS